MYALSDWLLERWQHAQRTGVLPSKILLTKDQELQLWQRAIAQAPAEAELIHPAAAAEQACQARDLLLRWCIALDHDAVRQRFQMESDCAAFDTWRRVFETDLLRGDWATPG